MTDDNIALGMQLKTEGNSFFMQKEFKKAALRYRKVFLYVNGLIDESSEYARYTSKSSNDALLDLEQAKTVLNLKISCQSNLAMCYVHLKEYEKALEQCQKAKLLMEKEENSELVTKFEPKIMFRESKALLSLKRFDKAKKCLMEAVTKYPNNKELRSGVENLRKDYAEWKLVQDAKQKLAFKNVLG